MCTRWMSSARPHGGQRPAEARRTGRRSGRRRRSRSHGRVVDLEHRARVVAELAHEAEVEDQAVGARPLGSSSWIASGSRSPRRAARSPARAPRGRRAGCRQRSSRSLRGGRQAELRDVDLERRRGRAARGGSSSGRARVLGHLERRRAASGRGSRRQGRAGGRRRPAARSASSTSATTSASPAGPGSPISSSPPCRNSRAWPRRRPGRGRRGRSSRAGAAARRRA